ncbi:Frizzled-10-A, partial [Trichinella sp. T6]
MSRETTEIDAQIKGRTSKGRAVLSWLLAASMTATSRRCALSTRQSLLLARQSVIAPMKKLYCFLIVVICNLSICTMSSFRSCERIMVPLCKDMPYNLTRLPNLMGDTDQNSVAQSLLDFEPLVNIKCSKNLRFFLCSVFTPMCTEAMDEPITSCRSVCQEVERSCAPLLSNFGLAWPALLNCSQFPAQNSEPPCMDPSPSKQKEDTLRKDSRTKLNLSKQTSAIDRMAPSSEFPTTAVAVAASCGPQFVHIDRHEMQYHKCVLRCNQDWMFTEEQKNFAQVWMAIWASVCFLSTGFTVMTFLLDTSRFTYPKRPIVFIAICYCATSVGYLLRLLVGREAAGCQQLDSGQSVLVSHSLSNAVCVVTFILLYYFGLASAVWWLILTMTWYLAAGRKWSQEAIARLSSTFHIIAWVIPASLTVTLLVTHELEASELTSMCFVCLHSSSALFGFVVGPVAVFSAIGICFMVAGIVSMVRISREMRFRICDTDLQKLRKLMTKVCVFSLLYVVLTLIVVVCSVYEKFFDEEWLSSQFECRPQSFKDATTGVGLRHCNMSGMGSLSPPAVEIYMLKVFISLTVGIMSSMWIWSKKTLLMWHHFFCEKLFSNPVAKSGPAQYAQGSSTLHHPSQDRPGILNPEVSAKVQQLIKEKFSTKSITVHRFQRKIIVIREVR